MVIMDKRELNECLKWVNGNVGRNREIVNIKCVKVR